MNHRVAETISVLEQLIGFPTVSDTSNTALIEYISAYCRDSAGLIHRLDDPQEDKSSLLLRFGPNTPGGILLSGHTDVVPAGGSGWESDPFTLTRSGDRLYGRGTADMKGFIAASMAVAVRDADRLRRPVYLALTYNEEVGCLAAPPLIDSFLPLVSSIDAVIVGEPTGMRPVSGNKGISEYITTFRGKSAHSSKPHLGINAIEIAHRYIDFILHLAAEFRKEEAADSSCNPPYTSVQVGTISGGTATNVVPDYCRVSCDLRSFHTADRLYFEQQMEQTRRSLIQEYGLGDSGIMTTQTCNVPPLEPRHDSVALQLAAELTGILEPEQVPYATEAGQFQQAGFSTVILGPGSIEQAHQVNEWLSVDQLTSAVRFIEKIFSRQMY